MIYSSSYIRKMYGQIIFATIMANLILNAHAASTATSRADPKTLEPSRLSILDFEDSKNPDDHAQRLHTEELEQLGSIAYAFRNQFRDVLEELIIQAFKYLRATFNDIKVRLFKRLGRYTLSDLFHATFDGVADFVVDATTDANLAVFNAEEEPSRPSYGYSHYPYVPPHPYSMRADGTIVKKITILKEVFKKSLQAIRGDQNDAKEQNSNTTPRKDYEKKQIEPGTKGNILIEHHNPKNHGNNVNSSYLSTSNEKEKMLLSFLPDVRDMNEHETSALKMEILKSIRKLKENRGSNFHIDRIQSTLSPNMRSFRPTSNVRTTSLSQTLSTTTANSLDRNENENFPELVLVNS